MSLATSPPRSGAATVAWAEPEDDPSETYPETFSELVDRLGDLENEGQLPGVHFSGNRDLARELDEHSMLGEAAVVKVWDALLTFAAYTRQENKPWVDKEQLGLAHYAEDNDVEVITTQVRVDYPGSPQNGRKYDGLVVNGDGENTYDGIEIKSGGALAKYLQPGNTQYQFDNAVNAGTPARGTLDGNEILVTRVIIREEP